jgi:hypothetical protein
MKKHTIFDITQDELDFLYAHIQKLKETIAVLENTRIMNEAQLKVLRDVQEDRNKQTVPQQ